MRLPGSPTLWRQHGFHDRTVTSTARPPPSHPLRSPLRTSAPHASSSLCSFSVCTADLALPASRAQAPPPAIVQALAPGVVAAKAAAAWVQSLAQAVRPDEDALIGALHRNEPGWSAAYAAYLASGGYARQVGPPLIRTLRMPTLVIWGEADPILPLSDAFAFECDLPNCVGVERVRHAGHSPHLDDPEVVAAILSRFLEERFDEFDALRGPGGEDQDGVRRREEYREARPPIG